MSEDFEISLGADFERQLTSIVPVMAFRIPPLQQAVGYHCSSWEGNHLWTGRCRVLSKGKATRIVLDDPNTGAVFGECPLDHPNAVEQVVDSARFFVIRIVNGTKHAFIGIGFNERNQAFDFKVAIEESKRIAKEIEEQASSPQSSGPVEIKSSGTVYSLQDDQKITINIPGGATGRKKRVVASGGIHL